MNAAQKIIERMPQQFTRRDILRCAKKLGYSYATANGVVDKMIYEDMCKRTGNGVYQKLEPEAEQDKGGKNKVQAEEGKGEPAEAEEPDEWIDDFEDNFLDDIEI